MSDDFIADFVQEAQELLDSAEPLLVDLSDAAALASVDYEQINSIFRLFHSIKGGAGYLNFNHVVGVTHEAEALLDLFRNGTSTIAHHHVELFLRTTDFLRSVLDSVAQDGDDSSAADRSPGLIAELQSTLRSTQAGDPQATGQPPPLPLDPPTPTPAEPVAVATPSRAEAAGAEGGSGMFAMSEMIAPFLSEAEELLLNAEERIHKLSDDDANIEELIGAVFRDIHSFKGNCGFLGFADGERIGHALEEALELAKGGQLSIAGSFTETALFCIDGMRAMVEDVTNGGDGRIIGVDAYTDLVADTVRSSLTAGTGAIPAPAETPAEPETGPQPVPVPADEAPQPATTSYEPDGGGDHWASLAAKVPASAVVPVSEAPPAPPPVGPVTSEPTAPSAQLPTNAAIQPAAATAVTKPMAAARPESKPAAAPAPSSASQPTQSSRPAAGESRKGTKTAGKDSQNKAETRRESSKRTAAAPQRQDIRVDITKLDHLVDLVGELVTAEVMVTQNPDLEGLELERFETAVHHLRRIIVDLQDVAMSVRMVPLEMTLKRMLRLTHDVSSKLGKKVKLELIGIETEVDKTVVESIVDPLVHIVRNSIDHGFEMPDERVAAGKPETGTLRIEAGHVSGEVVIKISDDGRGLNRERILSKAVERGIVSGDGSDLADEAVYGLIFEPGFSTAAQVTDVSGRGVGMDVVKRNIEKLHGRIDLASTPGQGTSTILRIPLTMAIMDGMLVRVGATSFTVPIFNIRESLKPQVSMVTQTMDGQEVLRIREDLVPILRLHEIFDKKADSEKIEACLVVVVESRDARYCLLVDEVLGQQQAVVKPVPSYLGSMRGISGCTILGDGRVSLIIDVNSLVDMAGEAEPSATANRR